MSVFYFRPTASPIHNILHLSRSSRKPSSLLLTCAQFSLYTPNLPLTNFKRIDTPTQRTRYHHHRRRPSRSYPSSRKLDKMNARWCRRRSTESVLTEGGRTVVRTWESGVVIWWGGRGSTRWSRGGCARAEGGATCEDDDGVEGSARIGSGRGERRKYVFEECSTWNDGRGSNRARGRARG